MIHTGMHTMIVSHVEGCLDPRPTSAVTLGGVLTRRGQEWQEPPRTVFLKARNAKGALVSFSTLLSLRKLKSCSKLMHPDWASRDGQFPSLPLLHPNFCPRSFNKFPEKQCNGTLIPGKHSDHTEILPALCLPPQPPALKTSHRNPWKASL